MKYLILLLLLLNFNILAVTEFVVTLNKTGQDYDTLTEAVAALKLAGNITASDCKVFAHGGITGTIADSASVSGVSSGATGTVIHCTSTQILIDAISGTFQAEQIQVDGDNYVTSTDTGDGVALRMDIYDDDGTLTETGSYIDTSGFTTSATNYVKISAPEGERHSGTIGSGATINFVMSSGSSFIYIHSENIIIEWLVMTGSMNSSYSGAAGMYFYESFGSVVRNCIMYNFINNNATAKIAAIGMFNAWAPPDGDYDYAFNNIIYNCEGDGVWTNGGSNHVLVNNTVYNCGGYGFNEGSGSAYLYNNIAIGNTTADYDTGMAVLTACASGDTSGSAGLQEITTSVFVSVTPSSEDLHIVSGTDLQDAGTDYGSAFGVAIDIDGRDRDAEGDVWDVGADEYVAPPGPGDPLVGCIF